MNRRTRLVASLACVLIAIGSLFAISVAAGLLVTGLFGPIALGTTFLVMGTARRPAPWPWLVGLSVALVPAFWLASVDLCGDVAGTCPTGDELGNSRQAVVSVVLFLAAAGTLALRRTRTRDAVFAALVLAGELWLLTRLLALDEPPAAILVVLLVALGVGYEVVARTRARSRAPAAAA